MKRVMNKMIAAMLFLVFGAIVFAMAPSVKALDTSKVQVVDIKKITDEGNYGNVMWSPDGNKLYALSFPKGDQKQWGWVIMNPDGTGKQVRWDEYPRDFSPDKTKYVYTDESYLGVANADGSGARRLGQIKATEARWSPTGNKIFFLRENKYYSVSPDGTGLTLIYDFDKQQKAVAIWGFAVSPDGQSLAVGSALSIQWKMIDTNEGITIYTTGGDPIWSPDGRKIYSTTGAIKSFDAETLSVSGDLTKSGPESADHFDIDFNRGLIVYTLTEDYIEPETGFVETSLDNIWIMDMSGTGQRKLTTDKAAEAWKTNVAISPDGRYIAYNNDLDNNVYVIELMYQP